MTILAIETSCDESAVSILSDGNILMNLISSQIKNHKEFGGVIPELASRLHEKNLPILIRQALKFIKQNKIELDYIAYTSEPGLSGSLHIGQVTATTLSLLLKVKLLKVNHMIGHFYSAFIDNQIKYPVLSVIVSGGHTQLMLAKNHKDREIIGDTLDDAIGECYDKVSKKMNLGYPGGPIIDKLAMKNDKEIIKFPVTNIKNSFDFSYSGLKTSIINYLEKNKKYDKKQVADSFQRAAISQIINKVKLAKDKYKPSSITLVGGVSANSRLRKEIQNLKDNNTNIFLPKMEYTTDNAAMIAYAAYANIKKI